MMMMIVMTMTMMMMMVMEDLRKPLKGRIVRMDFRRQLMGSGEHFGTAVVTVGDLYYLRVAKLLYQ
jgi:hypothetical protein